MSELNLQNDCALNATPIEICKQKIEEGRSERIFWLDLIRVIAIMLVVFLHCTETAYPVNMEGMNSLSTSRMLYSITVFVLGRVSVPLFLLLSGYLLLDKQYTSKNVLKFYKHNVLPLVFAYQICLAVILTYYSIADKNHYSLLYVLKVLLFLDSVNTLHLWYMSVIIGLYMTVPFVAVVLQKFSFKAIVPCMLIIYFALFLIPFLQDVLMVNDVYLYPELSVGFGIIPPFAGGGFGLYLVLGYYIKKAPLFLNNLWRIIFFLFLLAISVFHQYVSLKLENGMLWYDYYTLPFMSWLLFNMIRTTFYNKKNNLIISKLSTFSFGIYLYHYVFLLFFSKLEAISLPMFAESLVLFALTFVCSTLTVFLIDLIPHAGRILFLIKHNKKKVPEIPPEILQKEENSSQN